MIKIDVNYLPKENDPLWTCIPEEVTISTVWEVEEQEDWEELKEYSAITIDFLDDETYADLPIPPNKIAFVELGTAQEGLDKLMALGYRPPTVEEVCAEYGTHLGQFDFDGVEIKEG